MAFLGVALNDACIAAVSEAGVLYAEPGCALLEGNQAVYGSDALAAARIRPTEFNDRYWQEMSEAGIPGGRGDFQSHADLAFGQLAQLWSVCSPGVDAVGFAVPSSWSRDQLALFLGLAQEVEMPVVGIAQLAVAATRCPYPDRELFSLEAGTHSIAVARMEADSAAIVGDAEVVGDIGIARLRRATSEYFARAFLENSRFDPLHNATTEQRLYDRQSEWIRQLNSQQHMRITLERNGDNYAADVSYDALADAIGRVAQPLIQTLRALVSINLPTALQVSAELAAFPGVRGALESLPGCTVFELEPAAAARGLYVRQAGLKRADAGYTVSHTLPLDQPAAEYESTPVAQQTGALPTHLLHNHRAYRLGEQPLRIGLEPSDNDYGLVVPAAHVGVSRQHCSIELVDGRMQLNDHSRFGTELNGRPVQESAVLQPGDVISIGRPPCQFSLVEECGPGGEHAA